MLPHPHTSAVAHSPQQDEGLFTRAGCMRLTSLTRGAAGSRGCTRGLPRLPRAPVRGGNAWKAIPAWDTDPEAPAHAAPRDVA